MKVILVFVLCTVPLHAQTGAANTSGPCSPAVTGNNNQFTIRCEGVSKAEGDKILAVMNKILANQLDTGIVLKKLDEVLKTRSSLNQNCPNGICAGGDITGNPTVYNAPPQRRLLAEQKNALVTCLQRNPGRFTVASLQRMPHAERGCKAGQRNVCKCGLRISVSGDWDEASRRALLKEGSPEKDAAVCLQNAKDVGGSLIPFKDQPTGTIRIDVSDQAKP